MIANVGGGAANGRWTKTGQQNATVTPDAARGGDPLVPLHRHQCRPRREGQGLLPSHLDGGGGERRLDPGTEGEILYLGEVTGTSSWDESPCPFESHQAFSYSAKLEKSSHTGGPQLPFPLVDEQTLANPGVGIAAWGNDKSGAEPGRAAHVRPGAARTAPAPRCRRRRTRGTGT